VANLTALSVRLPVADGGLEDYRLGQPSPLPARAAPPRTRIAFAAAHVVADPLASADPWLETAIDWEATLACRRHLWDLGFAIAEAMDTAQRGMGLDWRASQELIARSLGEARAVGASARIACGAGTDHIASGSLDEVVAAYEAQCAYVEAEGGRIILMASRALAAAARGPDDYAMVYGRILAQVKEPVILHWLGDMFDPALAGYWGSKDLDEAMQTCLAIVEAVGWRWPASFVEWMMGWPLQWTVLQPLEMGNFREWQQQHSPRSPQSLSEAA
jgi:hypothetical protein